MYSGRKRRSPLQGKTGNQAPLRVRIDWRDRPDLLADLKRKLGRGVPNKRLEHVNDRLFGEVQRASPAAKSALEELVQASAHPNAMFADLQDCLRSCWYAYRFGGEDDKTRYGMRRASYYRLSKRLSALSDEIQSVNASLIGSPVRSLEGLLRAAPPGGGKGGSASGARRPVTEAQQLAWYTRLLKNARDLPDVLQDYAFALRLRTRKRKPSHRNIIRDQWIYLMDLVESETGKSHDSAVATVLEAVAAVAGKSPDIAPKALADCRRRYARNPGKSPIKLDEDDPEYPLLEEFLDSLPPPASRP
jgi:hypothetical protein